MYRPVLITAPTTTPVSLAEAKAHCRRAEDTDDDVILTTLIAAATAYLDGWTGILGRCLVEQTWRQDFDCFERCLRLPLYPVISITNVKYFDASSVEQTVDSANYVNLADERGGYVKFKNVYSFAATQSERPRVSVTYKAGYPTDGALPTGPLPGSIKSAMLLLIEHWFNNRGAVVVGSSLTVMPLPIAVDALLAPYRRVRF